MFPEFIQLKKRWQDLSFVEKAVVLSSTGGQLSNEDAESFIDTVVDMSAFLGKITTEKFTSSTMTIDTITIATRQFTAAVEATLAGTAQAVNFSAVIPRRTMTPVEVILAADITMTFLKENIEQAAAEQKLLNMIAKAVQNDVLDLAINGDGSTGTFLAINTGWIALALADSAVNDVDCSGLGPTDALEKIVDGMPSQYLGKEDMAFQCSFKFARAYKREIGNRATGLGDVAITTAKIPDFDGFEVEPIYSWPDDYVQMTPRKNLHVGWNKDITRESQRKPRKQIVEHTMTLKFDPEYAYGGWTVLGAGISL